MKAAFREVVAAPATSTVQVYCDGYKTVLGTIVDPAGYVVTKASELKGKVECQLNVTGGKRYDAVEIGRDKDLDLVVLKIDAKDLRPITWSDEEKPSVGTWLVTPGLSSEPLSIGVLSVGPRRIRPPDAALGHRSHWAERTGSNPRRERRQPGLEGWPEARRHRVAHQR